MTSSIEQAPAQDQIHVNPVVYDEKLDEVASLGSQDYSKVDQV